MPDTPEAPAEWVPLAKLRPHPRNARKHLTRSQVVESLEAHSQYRPLIVQRSTGYVLAGNGLLHAMLESGHTEAWVWWQDVDPAEALAILLVDNATSDGSGYDDPKLLALLTEASKAGSLIGTGYGQQQLDDLQAMLGPALSPADLRKQHGGDEPEDTWWPTLRVRAPQKTQDRYSRLADLTGEKEPAAQLLRIVVWAEKGRPK